MTEVRKYTANDNWAFTEYGFDIQVRPREAYIQPHIPPYTLVANVEKFSSANGKLVEEDTFSDQTLLNLLFGFQAFFEKMELPEFLDKKPSFVYGRTFRRKMAKVISKLGFQVTQEGPYFVCTGETDDVRSKIDKYFTSKKGVIDVLQRRVASTH